MNMDRKGCAFAMYQRGRPTYHKRNSYVSKGKQADIFTCLLYNILQF